MIAHSLPMLGKGTLGDSLGGQPLVYSNEDGGPFAYYPARLTITLTPGPGRPTVDRARLLLPAGWSLAGGAAVRALDGGKAVSWDVVPAGTPATCRPLVRCELLAGEESAATLEAPIAVELRGRSRFDSRRDPPPFRNDAGDLGAVEPQRALFARTYLAGGMVLPGAFFRGLYRDIVFLAAGPDARGGGGLCTGMARFALGRSLGEVRTLIGGEREEVQVWHGRQLTDAALLAAASQFFRPSPAAAFRRFRDGVLATGGGTVAFDIGIARWNPSPATWIATLRRLVTQGHTVVPYAFQQTDDDSATVQVYDPSHPDREDTPHNVMRFDLARDRYAYRGFGALDRDDGTTALAVPQRAFARPGSAFIASLVNLALHPDAVRAEVRENAAVRRGLLRAGVGMLLGGVGFLLARWRRRTDSSLRSE